MEQPEISAEVTRLQPTAVVVTIPEPEPIPQPEVVVIENNTTIEQTPEGNTAWQERIEATLRESSTQHQQRTLEMVETIQSFREILDRVLSCLIRLEANQSTPLQPNPEPPAPAASETVVIVTEPEEAETPKTPENPEQSPKEKSKKKRRRI